MNNRLDTSSTRQQMVSHFTAFSKARKVHSEDQRPDSKQALNQCPEDNRGDGTSTSDSSETRDPIAHKNDFGPGSSEASAKPPLKRPRKRQKKHTPSTSSSEGYSHRKRHHRRYSSSSFSSSSSSPKISSLIQFFQWPPLTPKKAQAPQDQEILSRELLPRIHYMCPSSA